MAHKGPKMGAALAYYTAFSLAPLLVLLAGILGLVIDNDTARTALVGQIHDLMGDEGGAMVEAILQRSAPHEKGVLATIIGSVVLLLGASGVFVELHDSLNTIWETPPRSRPWVAFICERLLSFAMVFALGFLVLVSLVASAILAAVGSYVKGWAPGFEVLLEAANSLVSFVVVTMLFGGLFRFLPDVKVAWRNVWAGAVITAALFILGKFLIGFYIGRSSFASAYGAAGSLVIVLVWVFYSAQIFFFGAEFTRAFARTNGGVRTARHSDRTTSLAAMPAAPEGNL